MTDMNDLLRLASGRSRELPIEAEAAVTSFDGGCREPMPVAPTFNALLTAEFESRRQERSELAAHYDGVVADPLTLLTGEDG